MVMGMKHLSLALISLLLASRVAGEQTAPRFVAPVNQKELDERVGELRRQCEPFMRSLPKPLPERERTALPTEWKFTFEAKATPKTEGVPPAPAWQGADFDDARWKKTTVPEWRYRTRESDSAIDPSAIARVTLPNILFDPKARAEGLGLSMLSAGCRWREGCVGCAHPSDASQFYIPQENIALG